MESETSTTTMAQMRKSEGLNKEKESEEHMREVGVV